jgi:hypothetical protein
MSDKLSKTLLGLAFVLSSHTNGNLLINRPRISMIKQTYSKSLNSEVFSSNSYARIASVDLGLL